MNSSNGLRRDRWVHHHDVGHPDNTGDRCDVADEIEIEIVVESCADRVRGIDQEESISVPRRAHDGLGGDIAGRARTVLNDEWLSEPFRQPLTHEACDDVAHTAGGIAHDDAHGSRGKGLRARTLDICKAGNDGE